jgi:zinc/manganese transport system substrate-binding protein/manganese/iron transport system substrate-binding protein
VVSSFDRRCFLAGAFGALGIFALRFERWTSAQVASPFASPVALPPTEVRADGPLRVVTSTSILADLARQIGGDRVEVRSILPPNADPHDFEPSPEDVIAIEDADVVLLHGLQLDTWADPLIEAAQTDAPVVTATAGIPTIGSDDSEFSDGDPHVWFDPQRVKLMVANIRDALASVDEEGATGYRARLDAYEQSLDQLDREIADRITSIPPDRRVLVTNHDALEYFADRYGLEIVGTVIPGLDSRAEPSAKEIAALIERIEEAGVNVIFAENTVSPALAESLASDAGIKVAPELYTDSLGDAGSGAETYIGLMQTDTDIIVENLRA